MICLYEKKNIPVNKQLIGRFVQSADIARLFHIYYDLYNKYKSDYQIGDILAGNADELVIQRAAEAQFDERITVISLLLDSIMENICSFSETEEVILKLLQILKKFKTDITKPMAVPYKCMQDSIKQQSANFNRKESSGTVSPEDKKKYMKLNSHLTECCSKIENVLDGEEAFSIVKKYYDEQVTDPFCVFAIGFVSLLRLRILWMSKCYPTYLFKNVKNRNPVLYYLRKWH